MAIRSSSPKCCALADVGTLRDAVLSRVLRSPRVLGLLELVAIVPSRAERSVIDAILAPSPRVVAAALSSDSCPLTATATRSATSSRGSPSPTRLDDRARKRCIRKCSPRYRPNRPAKWPRRDSSTTLRTPATETAVLRYAPQAAAKAAAHGAHSEAAALHKVALDHAEQAAPQTRADMLEAACV
jgi:hypothetical protein